MENFIVWSEIGSGLENRVAHPHQEFRGVPPPPPSGLAFYLDQIPVNCINYPSSFRPFLNNCVFGLPPRFCCGYLSSHYVQVSLEKMSVSEVDINQILCYGPERPIETYSYYSLF